MGDTNKAATSNPVITRIGQVEVKQTMSNDRTTAQIAISTVAPNKVAVPSQQQNTDKKNMVTINDFNKFLNKLVGETSAARGTNTSPNTTTIDSTQKGETIAAKITSKYANILANVEQVNNTTVPSTSTSTSNTSPSVQVRVMPKQSMSLLKKMDSVPVILKEGSALRVKYVPRAEAKIHRNQVNYIFVFRLF